MRPDDIYKKTEKGQEEVLNRTHNLPGVLRTLLIMTDGRTKAGDLLKKTAALKATGDIIDQLAAEGYIGIEMASRPSQQTPKTQNASASETVTPEVAATAGTERERFSHAQRFMNESSVNASGLRSFTFTLRLEKCQGLADLRALLPDYIKLIEKGVGGVEAEVLITKAKDLLA